MITLLTIIAIVLLITLLAGGIILAIVAGGIFLLPALLDVSIAALLIVGLIKKITNKKGTK